MPDFTPAGMLFVFAVTLVAALGWTLGSAIMAALLGLLSRGG